MLRDLLFIVLVMTQSGGKIQIVRSHRGFALFTVKEKHDQAITLFSMDKTHNKTEKFSMSLRIHDRSFIQSCIFNVTATGCKLSNSALKNIVLSEKSTLFFDSIPTLTSCTFENVSVTSEKNPFLLNYFQNADNLIEHSLFNKCNVSHGSLIHVCAFVNLTVKHSSFCENEGSESGCIFLLTSESNDKTITIEDSYFRNNRHRHYTFDTAFEFGNDITSTNIFTLACVDTRFASIDPQIVVNNKPIETKENITELYLDPIGNDSIGCGTNTSYLCKTFSMAMTLQGNTTNRFFLRPSGLFCEKGVECIKKTMTILGQKHATLELSNEASSFIVRNESFLTVKQVIFHIDKLPHGHFFTCLDSTLIIDDTDYTICFNEVASDISRALTVSLFVATRSQLNITDMRFTGSDSLVISAPLVSLQNSSSDIQIDFWKVTVSEDVSLLNSNVFANNSVLIHNCSLRESEVSRNSSFFSSTVGSNGSLKVVNCSFHSLTSSDDETYHLITLNVTSHETNVNVRNNDYSSLAHANENGTIVSVSFSDSQNHSEWLRQSFPAPYP
ncbi:hypothetical protein BLNAU_20524 [Blattamonas nauphoetae]|uniref:Uncharacterized protein n=1 Tax=Blattamonas nauphoetae TaxID=2049346 RepID=A0ABQ9WYH1_9EUKA|nr:hypothetical protein BLNAU_20524 [Blattamonas nauphoetae]